MCRTIACSDWRADAWSGSEVSGLTAAEARLARRVSLGAELKAVADDLGVTYETARNHLKAVFAKTETHRQPELVALLARIASTAQTA
ncbi:hypothetical protein MES4922_110358 [Mesorhizobium ventifaucium]|uniref:HTH luxR-type domain-containing protein n=1 Tax=Mesorhizobium ventifaucium TaxID=666020 RepID=A0ABN8JBW7_9HYPH|nr:hypothetical protein MES4922_110358 [Mesorhizobium ventifaucium]